MGTVSETLILFASWEGVPLTLVELVLPFMNLSLKKDFNNELLIGLQLLREDYISKPCSKTIAIQQNLLAFT